VAQLGKAEGNSPNTSVSGSEANQPNGNILIVGCVGDTRDSGGVPVCAGGQERDLVGGVSGMGYLINSMTAFFEVFACASIAIDACARICCFASFDVSTVYSVSFILERA